MKKKILSTVLSSTMIASMAMGVCAAEGSEEAAVKADAESRIAKAEEIVVEGGFEEEYTWSLATTYSTGTPMVNAYHKFSDLVNEYTGGAVTINVFADSSLMGENDSFLALRSGELEFAGFGPSTIYLYSEDVGFVLAPYLIPDYASYRKIYDSDVLQEKVELWANEYNTRDVAGMVYRGFRNMSCNKAIQTIDDLKGIKLRLNDNQMWSDIWGSLGATTVPMALGELYTSLQNGTVDASEGPWEQVAVNNLGEVQDYVIQTKHVPESVGIWMANDVYESLPENYQAVIDKAGLEAVAALELEAVEMENQYLQELIDAGCEYIENPDLTGFKDAAEEEWKKYFESTWTAATYDEVLSIISEE